MNRRAPGPFRTGRRGYAREDVDAYVAATDAELARLRAEAYGRHRTLELDVAGQPGGPESPRRPVDPPQSGVAGSDGSAPTGGDVGRGEATLPRPSGVVAAVRISGRSPAPEDEQTVLIDRAPLDVDGPSGQTARVPDLDGVDPYPGDSAGRGPGVPRGSAPAGRSPLARRPLTRPPLTRPPLVVPAGSQPAARQASGAPPAALQPAVTKPVAPPDPEPTTQAPPAVVLAPEDVRSATASPAPPPTEPVGRHEGPDASDERYRLQPMEAERPRGALKRGDRWRIGILLVLSAAILGLAWTLLIRDSGQPGRSADSSSGTALAPGGQATVAPTEAAARPSQPAPPAPRAPAADAPVPAGWSTYRAPDGSFTLGLPPGWKPVGEPAEQRFISPSGLTTVSVRTAGADAAAGAAVLETDETELAARSRSYTRLQAGTSEHRGFPARTVDYRNGAGATQQRGSTLGVLVGDRAHWLTVESKATAWRFAEPLVGRFRATFVPA